jgi:ankyrin repeat protein
MTDYSVDLSVELCMIICSSTSDDTFIADEVYRLLTSGADVNFQDANRNFNTALHLAVMRQSVDLIKLLLTFHPRHNIRNMHGERAKDLALNLNQVDIAKLLDVYRKGSRDKQTASRDFAEHAFDLGVDVRAEFNAKYPTQYTSSRVQFLLSVSKIDPHFKRTSFDSHEVKETYAKLDENIQLRPLLKVAKEIKSLGIYFLHDPKNTELGSCSVNQLNGTIFIHGPRNGSSFAATLAHKLLHYAMLHIHDNECKPHRRRQAEKMIRYKKIVTIYKRSIETLNPVVQHVFDLPEALWEAELVACVPYFIAFYHDDPAALNNLTLLHKELFDFYFEVVLKDIDDYLVQSNLRKFKERPVEGSSFGRRTPYDPYRTERLEENYGSNYRDNKRNNRDLERICSIL